MKSCYLILPGLFLLALLGSCAPQSVSGSHSDLSVEAFEKEKNKNKDVQLIDVRTPGEFEQGHLEGALNYDIQSADFERQIESLDKSKPVLVYCLSGGRSASAAALLNEKGFVKVHNMSGGLLKWNAKGKPISSTETVPSTNEMTPDKFKELLRTDKFVLVDYNATWCKPCKRMEPMLNKLAGEKNTQLMLVKIDADENKSFLRKKGIESLPVLELYKNGKLIWKQNGETSEQEILEQIK